MANRIHPTAILQGDISLGDDNEIGPYSVLYGPLTLGNRNWIGPHVTIGTPGQDTRNPRYDCSRSPIAIGNDCIIREYTAIQKPCYADITRLGDRVFLMQSVHVPHDAVLDDDVVITPMVVMGGLVRVMRGANLAVGCSLHQYTVIGPYSIVAMGAAVTKNVKPFARYIPGKPLSLNEYALKKNGMLDAVEELTAYVVHDERPTSPQLLAIIEEYDRACAKSGRPSY